MLPMSYASLGLVQEVTWNEMVISPGLTNHIVIMLLLLRDMFIGLV